MKAATKAQRAEALEFLTAMDDAETPADRDDVLARALYAGMSRPPSYAESMQDTIDLD